VAISTDSSPKTDTDTDTDTDIGLDRPGLGESAELSLFEFAPSSPESEPLRILQRGRVPLAWRSFGDRFASCLGSFTTAVNRASSDGRRRCGSGLSATADVSLRWSCCLSAQRCPTSDGEWWCCAQRRTTYSEMQSN
jgi:hypothetical protein